MTAPTLTPLQQRVNGALINLRLARRNGDTERIKECARKLDALLDQLPR